MFLGFPKSKTFRGIMPPDLLDILHLWYLESSHKNPISAPEFYTCNYNNTRTTHALIRQDSFSLMSTKTWMTSRKHEKP